MTNFEKNWEEFAAERDSYCQRLCTGLARSRHGAKTRPIRVFWSWLKERRISPQELQSHHFIEYVLALESGALCKLVSRYSVGSMANLKSASLRWLRELHDGGKILHNPFADFTPNYPSKRPGRSALSRQQMKDLLSLPDLDSSHGLRNRAILEVAYGSALRLGELASLALDSVEFPRRLLHLKNTKNGWDRSVPLTRSSCRFLKCYLKQSRPQFSDLRSGSALWLGHLKRPLGVSAFQKMLCSYQKKLDFNVSFHTLRHTCATHLLEGGANIVSIARLLGHEDLSSTQIYTHLKAKELTKVQARCHPRGAGQMSKRSLS